MMADHNPAPWTMAAPPEAVAESMGCTRWSVAAGHWGTMLPVNVADLLAPPVVVRAAPLTISPTAPLPAPAPTAPPVIAATPATSPKATTSSKATTSFLESRHVLENRALESRHVLENRQALQSGHARQRGHGVHGNHACVGGTGPVAARRR
jgi:hypothetical protein